MKLPVVLIRKSTQEILKENAVYPAENMAPIDGLDPDLEFLIKVTPYAQPDYDSRIFVLQTTKEITSDPHPDYPHLNQFKTLFDTEKRSNAEIIVQIENAKQLANQALFNEDMPGFMVGVQEALNRKSEGLQLTQSEIDLLDKNSSISVKISQNAENAENLKSILLSGGTPLIDEGWESSI